MTIHDQGVKRFMLQPLRVEGTEIKPVIYSETAPYGHLGNTVPSLLRLLFKLAACQKPPYNFL